MNTKRQKEFKRAKSVRAKMSGSSLRPRLSVHKTNKHIYGQFVDDSKGKTLGAFSSTVLKAKATDKTKVEEASMVGSGLADVAKKIKVKAIVFDRGSNRYHGRVKALADAMRDGGVEF